MTIIYKKQYIVPQICSTELYVDTLLAGSDPHTSNLSGGGDNDQPSAPNVAESKRNDMFWLEVDDFDDMNQEDEQKKASK